MRAAGRASTGVALAAGLALVLATGLWARTTTSSSSSSSPSSSGSATTKQPAPGTTPVGGDIPAPTSAKNAPCYVPKNKKHKKNHKNSSNTDDINDAEPGLVSLTCAGRKGSNGFNPYRVVGVGSHMIKIRPGSIEDVNAIGTRKIGGRGLGNWYSENSEIKMGESYAAQIDKTTHFITDPVVDEYINRVGQNIVKNSDCKVPFTIKVIDTDEINAFALPGGFFYVNSGLILAADNEAELAGVMAHETAHVCAHHAVREMTRANYAQIGMLPLIMFTGYSWTGYGIYEAAQLAIPISMLEFSRQFEAQADYLGVQYMYKAGYDPQEYIDFFEKVEALEKRKPGIIAKVFDDHPETPDRILHTQEEIAEILPPRNEYLVNTSEFENVKARLARIENRHRLLQSHGGKKPSLRKVNTNSTNQPTLHRRNDGSIQN